MHGHAGGGRAHSRPPSTNSCTSSAVTRAQIERPDREPRVAAGSRADEDVEHVVLLDQAELVRRPRRDHEAERNRNHPRDDAPVPVHAASRLAAGALARLRPRRLAVGRCLPWSAASTAALHTDDLAASRDALDVRRRGGGGTVDGALGVVAARVGAGASTGSAPRWHRRRRARAASDAGTFSVWPHRSQRNVVDGTSPSSRCFAPHAGHSSAFAIRRPRTLVRPR